MKIAFIGGYGHHYLAGAVERGLAEVVGVASDGVDGDAAKKWGAKRFDDVRYYDDYRVMLDKVGAEAVSVGAVYAHNGEVVCEGLRRGLKICSDKPVVATHELLSEMRVLANGGVLVTEFNLRSDRAFRAAREAVRLDLIGVPVLATGQKSYKFGESRPEFYKSRVDYSGTVLWIASHAIDFVWFVTRKHFERVVGVGGNVARREYKEMEDHVALCYELADGGVAVVHADLLRPAGAGTHGDDQLRVVGSDGQLEVRDGKCVVITSEHNERDVTELGDGADVVGDLMAALDGDESYYSTDKSLYMADVMLKSRDAADNLEVVDLNAME